MVCWESLRGVLGYESGNKGETVDELIPVEHAGVELETVG